MAAAPRAPVAVPMDPKVKQRGHMITMCELLSVFHHLLVFSSEHWNSGTRLLTQSHMASPPWLPFGLRSHHTLLP